MAREKWLVLWLTALGWASVGMWGPPAWSAQRGSGTSGDVQGVRAQCDDLLRRARQAMAENDLQAARALLSQAEALGVEYPPLYPGDTPQKLRRDLERKTQTLQAGRGTGLLGALVGKNESPLPSDPFAAAQTAGGDLKALARQYLLEGRKALTAGNLEAAAAWYRKAVELQVPFEAHEDSPARLAADILRQGGQLAPPANSANTLQNLTPLPPTTVAGSGGQVPSVSGSAGVDPASRAESDRLLLEARRALASGDVRRATELVERAKSLNVPYGPQEDSPQRVETDIRNYAELVATRSTRGQSDLYRAQYARLLVQQAEGLLRHGDLDQAEYLASLAARQGVTFGPFETTPQNLLERIAAQRRQSGASSLAGTLPGAKEQAVALLRQARAALALGDIARAQQLALQAQSLQVPESAFAPGEDRPSLLLLQIQRLSLQTSAVTPAGYGAPSVGLLPPGVTLASANTALYQPGTDPTFNRYASGQGWPAATPGPTVGMSMPSGGVARALLEQGEAALRNQDYVTAAQYFQQAARYMHELDPLTAQRLQDRLQLTAMQVPGTQQPVDPGLAAQQERFQRVAMEVAHQEGRAKAMLESDPKGAVAVLEEARKQVETAGLEPRQRDALLARLDRALAEARDYLERNRLQIELRERNRAVEQEVQQRQMSRLERQERMAQLVDEFNRAMEEQRFAEAEVIAKRANELDPENPLAQQLMLNAKLVRRFFDNLALQNAREQGFMDQMRSVELAAIPYNDMIPYAHGDAREWQALTKRRSKYRDEGRISRTEQELEIERRLRTPVLLQFQNAPLSQVMDYLARMAGINLHLDPQGLAEMGVSSDEPVTINLSQEISVKSALNLILEPLGLGYVIQDEVLKVTSEQRRQGKLYRKVYYVADLVTPIPNFAPSSNLGLAGAYRDALAAVGFGGSSPWGGFGPVAVVATPDGRGSIPARINPAVLAQMGGGTAPQATPTNIPLMGPGGMGGGGLANFDALIDLITTVVAPTTWEEVGGPGSIAPFEANLSLVVSQTQEVHEQIADLLEQLRRIQDLQVTIEVRFITLNDNFFERIGVDFDFDVDNNVGRRGLAFGAPLDEGDPEENREPLRNTLDAVRDKSVIVGMQQPGIFSADLDVPFRQGHFELAVPQFGGFDASAGATLGFAILSDIEAFFFINAAQGDRRSNVLQAPKVTLFNGQQGTVWDAAQTPFVMALIPVVGDFAAAQQPVIVVVSEGTFLTVQATVSQDRRFVRLTVVPYFSRIEKVDTFTFEGTETTIENTSQQGNQDTPNDNTRRSRESTRIRQGTSVQLPTVASISVATTVSVPDGGTVLLGGIKRLAEGRNEFGVPILNKLPYVSRLFKNVGIGRETQSLMMMVTPRIIIQEEEEERLGIALE
jgi:general secretion pathway protein D